MRYWCCVCREPVVFPHTYHDEGCPARADDGADCIDIGNCGEDCHSRCCPTCNPKGSDERHPALPAD